MEKNTNQKNESINGTKSTNKRTIKPKNISYYLTKLSIRFNKSLVKQARVSFLLLQKPLSTSVFDHVQPAFILNVILEGKKWLRMR